MKTISARLFCTLMGGLLLLSACATPTLQPAEDQIVPMQKTIDEISEFQSEMDQARQDQLDVLSPGSFAKAEASFAKAKAGAEKGTQLTSIVDHIADASGHLDNASENAKLARTMLPQVIESRRMARLAGAVKLEDEYADVEERFLKLTEAIEKNNINYTKRNAAKVDGAYRNLELTAIKNEAIGKAREVVAEAEKHDAKKYAPQSFEVARQRLVETDEFITKNRYAKEEIGKRAKEDLFYAYRALVLTEQSQALEKMKPEEHLLREEAFLNGITTQLEARDLRDQSIDDQVDNILKSIGALQDDNKGLAEQLASSQQEIAQLNQKLALSENKSIEEKKANEVLLADQKAKEAQLLQEKERILTKQKMTAQQLEEERQFNQKFIEIKNSFAADEAEVYKSGNQLIVRLKGIQFQVGQAVITPENYRLLSKVQRAITAFDSPSVVVEGHTDSTGGHEANQILSEQRAQAVQDYLVANKTIPADKIDARGYGPTRPLASNKTAEGRAMNRRIDVVINPSVIPTGKN